MPEHTTDDAVAQESGRTFYEAPVQQELQKEENKIVNKALTAFPEPYISGLKLNEDITLGNLTLNKIDSNNVVWICTDIKGWWEHPDPQFPDLTRGWGDGSYDADGRYQARTITIEGSILPPDPTYAPAARKTLVEQTDLVYKGDYLKVNESPTKSAYVRLSGRPLIKSVNARGRMDFSISLKAADPIKYEYLENTYRTINISSSTQVTNSGNTRTPVIFEITGTNLSSGSITNSYTSPYTAASVTDTIGGISKTWSGGSLEIDTYNRNMIRVNSDSSVESGRPYANALVDWIYLYPGTNTFNFSASGTSPVCTLYYRSGWIA